MDGAIPLTRLSHSVPGSPVDDRLNAGEVIGSAESLVGRVFALLTIYIIRNIIYILRSKINLISLAYNLNSINIITKSLK